MAFEGKAGEDVRPRERRKTYLRAERAMCVEDKKRERTRGASA
jgi:hypothetical protein